LSAWQIKLGAQVVRNGGVIAYPTEAVYGLGCDPLNAAAVLHLLDIKQRRSGKGVILIAAAFEQLMPYLGTLEAQVLARICSSWPGPATWVVPAAAHVPHYLTAANGTIAVRVTAHPLAAALCRVVGSAIVSTSANLREQQAARNALQVRLKLGQAVDYVVTGAVGHAQQPTIIRDAVNGEIYRHA